MNLTTRGLSLAIVTGLLVGLFVSPHLVGWWLVIAR